MDNYINQVISDRYEIKEIIGVGGMAKVYKAYDRVDDRIVAVKILKDEYLASEEYRVRFKNESRAISLLNHINVVKVYDVCFGDDLQYIVMEHVEGITLKEFIEKQKVLDWKEALIIVVQILRALQHAHDKGVIHRDIKPQNILLLSNATIKVTDFGIASFKRGNLSSPEDTEAIGSVHYVSPEQAIGDYTDEKSDIYSVGVVLYEMLTGKMPFESEYEENVALMQLQNEAVRPTEINPSIPVGLEQITLRAMQKNAMDRYQSASEFLMDLDEFRRNPDILFDYHYFIDKTPTKFISTKNELPKDSSPVDEDGYDEDYEDDDGDEEGGRSSALPVLIGVAIALVLVVALIIFGVFGSSIKEVIFGESSSSEEGSFWDKLDIFGLFNKDDIEVPNFINMKFEEVLEKYPDLAIENPPQYEYNSTYEDGFVCNQYPDAGDKVSKDTVFKLTVATSGESVLVQDVSGKSSIEAESTLRAAGLVVELIPLVDETRAEGEVIYTKPTANTYAQYKSTVYVYYATGQNSISSARVPMVVGMELEAAKQNNVKKFVYASSSSVYGDEPNLPKKEGREGNLLSPYALTKRCDEEWAKQYTRHYGLDTYGMRYFNVFGRRQTPDGAYAAVIPKFIKMLLNGETPTINGDGKQSRDFTYIENVIEANLKACLAPHEAAGEAFNIAFGGREYLIDIYYGLTKALGVDIEPNFGPDRAGDIKHSNADISKAKEMLGYEPEWSFERGIEAAIEWYKENL